MGLMSDSVRDPSCEEVTSEGAGERLLMTTSSFALLAASAMLSAELLIGAVGRAFSENPIEIADEATAHGSEKQAATEKQKGKHQNHFWLAVMGLAVACEFHTVPDKHWILGLDEDCYAHVEMHQVNLISDALGPI